MAVHPKALLGFDKASEEYQRGRPDYPVALIAWLHEHVALPPQSHVLELGAGTGKFTRTLVDSDFQITAIEPVPAMREKLRADYPTITVLDGVAEHLPLAAVSADAVLVAQAFHWFDAEAALRECARVLKPDGALILLWNIRDDRVDWVQQFDQIIDAYADDTPRYKHGHWRDAFRVQEAFSELQHTSFHHLQTVTKEQLLDRALSTSFIAALADTERDIVIDHIQTLLHTHPALKDTATITLPYSTRLYWCRKR